MKSLNSDWELSVRPIDGLTDTFDEEFRRDPWVFRETWGLERLTWMRRSNCLRSLCFKVR